MGMTDDWRRLHDLELLQGSTQYGQNLQVTLRPGSSSTVQAFKDVVRWSGERTDLNAWRAYLAPWEPLGKTKVLPGLAAITYAQPAPWASPQPRTYDSFPDLPIFARITWGAGGVRNVAYVDWPKRGLLLQVSGNYLEVDALLDTTQDGIDPDQLPRLGATIGPEPGGGDAAAPATFTYRAAPAQVSAGPPASLSQNFQIPPFGRAFVPLLNWRDLIASASTIAILVQDLPGAQGATNEQLTFVTPQAGAYDQSLGRDPIQLPGQQSGNVRIVITGGAVPVGTLVGCMFQLDL